MCMSHGINCCMVFIKEQHFLPFTESPMVMTSGKVITSVRCGFHAGLWDFSSNSLPRRLEIVLERIAVPFKC